MMALPLRVLRYKSVMQSETRSLRAIWSRVKSGTGSPWATWSAQPWRLFWTGSKQAQRGGALGERQWRSTVDMSARRELLERIENESKAYGSDFGSQNLPTWQECATAVRSLCSQYELLSFSLCHYRASTLTWQECATAVRSLCSQYELLSFSLCHYRASTLTWQECATAVHSLCSQYVFLSFSLHMPLSRFHYASWAYLRSSYVHTALPLRLWRSWFISRCCSDAFNCFTMHSCYDFTSAWPFLPRYIVLVRAPTRCACFKHTYRSIEVLRLR